MLPIHEALPALKAALAERNCAVLLAPPGAGKTTVTPLALLDEPWVAGRTFVLLEPRRLAARAAARRMAGSLGEAVGGTVGLRIRGETRVSAETRIEVVTEGVFTRMILADPGLEGVAGVLFDEFHERSLDADLGLAFARDAQTILRADLRLIVMSATIDGAAVAALLGGAPVIESQGRAHAVQTCYLGRQQSSRLEAQVLDAVRRALEAERGSLLVFLPGAGEIRRAVAALDEAFGERPELLIAPLYGALDFGEQQRAIAPAPPGVRKIVLATSIAETSLTIEGVRVVIDSGLSRVPRYDPGSGLTRLVTTRVSRAGADQRRGRAGRTEPGVCYRLWDEPETRSLAPFNRPEILEADLAGLALDAAAWGVSSVERLALLDRPPQAAFAEARATLRRLEALDEAGGLSPHGRALAGLPLPPRLAHMLVRGAEAGSGELASLIAALLTERGVGGSDPDLGERLDRLRRGRDSRSDQARALAARWAATACRSLARGAGPGLSAGELLALAFPERVACVRTGGRGEYLLTSGRGARLDPADPLARAPWLAVGELASGGAHDRILLAAPIDETSLRSMFARDISVVREVDVDSQGRLRARRVQKLGACILGTEAVQASAEERIQVFSRHLRAQGLASLPAWAFTERLRSRVGFARSLAPQEWPDLDEEALLHGLESWLGSTLGVADTLADLSEQALEAALWLLIGSDRRRELDRLAPERFVSPAGLAHPIDYAAEGGPRVDVRVQELFGLGLHPTVGDGRSRLTLALLSPAHRPVQVTRDLPSFWAGSWKAVRAEMRGRYPKHPWPEDPLQAPPTSRAKPRGA